jgi:hypothetical protein
MRGPKISRIGAGGPTSGYPRGPRTPRGVLDRRTRIVMGTILIYNSGPELAVRGMSAVVALQAAWTFAIGAMLSSRKV